MNNDNGGRGFRCRLMMHVKSSDGARIFERPIILPFVPYVGLTLVGAMVHDDEVGPPTVDYVTWDIKKREFQVWIPEDDDTTMTLAEMLEYWGGEWTWKEPG